jgi:FMN-dependent NADH-azoreductase
MSNLLYIKASPMGELSYSIAAADAFIDAYLQIHPGDNVKTIDIFKMKLPPFDFKAASAKYKIMHGKEHSQKDRRIWDQIVSIIDEFKSADKYVMAVPMWNFSIPYRLKQYIDIIVQPGYTFTVDDKGSYEGLLRRSGYEGCRLVKGKPVFVVYARGGEYPPGTPGEAFDLQKKYLELILGFMGLTDVRSLIVEPTLAKGKDVAQQKRIEAIEKAKQIAKEF